MDIPNPENRDIRLPPKLWEEVQALAYTVKNEDMDLLCVIDGDEGSGKSKTARNLGAAFATALGTSFGVPNIHYSTQEYMESSDKMGKFSVHILDEAGVILHRGTSNSREAKKFTKFLQVARGGNNQIHIIVLPAYHLLDGYVVNWRARFVMHMFTYKEKTTDKNIPGGVKTARGGFKLWPKCDALTYNYHLAAEKHIYKYPTINPWIRDRVSNSEPLFPQELAALDQKKATWRTEFINGDDQKSQKNSKALSALKRAIGLLVREGWNDTAIAKEIGYSGAGVGKIRKELEAEAEARAGTKK